MGVKGRRVHMIEEMSDTIISFQRGSNFSVTVVFLTNSLVVLTLKLTLLDTNMIVRYFFQSTCRISLEASDWLTQLRLPTFKELVHQCICINVLYVVK